MAFDPPALEWLPPLWGTLTNEAESLLRAQWPWWNCVSDPGELRERIMYLEFNSKIKGY